MEPHFLDIEVIILTCTLFNHGNVQMNFKFTWPESASLFWNHLGSSQENTVKKTSKQVYITSKMSALHAYMTITSFRACYLSGRTQVSSLGAKQHHFGKFLPLKRIPCAEMCWSHYCTAEKLRKFVRDFWHILNVCSWCFLDKNSL